MDGAAKPYQGARDLRALLPPRHQVRLCRGHASLPGLRTRGGTALCRAHAVVAVARSVPGPRAGRRSHLLSVAVPSAPSAMILAAGRGNRMRPLTDLTPKPLLAGGGKPLLFRHLEKLSHAGFGTVTINHAHLGAQIEAAVGRGSRCKFQVRYPSPTQPLTPAHS